MKVVLFCGGFGTRLREHSETVPKPLVTVGSRPIIWNLMKYYAHYGHKDFILCLGYLGNLIKDYFLNYNECASNDFVFSEGGKKIEIFNNDIQDWRITFVDTGLSSNIAQRLLAVRKYLEGEEMFLANYSDGLTDLCLPNYIDKFKKSNAVASFLGVRPTHSLSGVQIKDSGEVRKIEYLSDSLWINGGFMVLRKEIFDYIEDGEELVEEPFQRLIQESKLIAVKHPGFWAAIDTFKDKKRFDDMFAEGDTPWAVWKNSDDRT